MAELDRPTESEIEAEDTLRAILEEITGDAGRADYHIEFVRREAVRIGRTKFMDYLSILAFEIPQLVVDPAYRAGAYKLQQLIDLCKTTTDEATLAGYVAEAQRIHDEEADRG